MPSAGLDHPITRQLNAQMSIDLVRSVGLVCSARLGHCIDVSTLPRSKPGPHRTDSVTGPSVPRLIRTQNARPSDCPGLLSRRPLMPRIGSNTADTAEPWPCPVVSRSP
jgi:hypothetical protein